MRLEMSNLNFSRKDGLKRLSGTKNQNCSSMIYQGLHRA